jgi:hypothetical protein
LTYDDEHHRFAFINLSLLQPDGTETDRHGMIGVDPVAYTYASLNDLFESYAQLKEKGISPVRWVHLRENRPGPIERVDGCGT